MMRAEERNHILHRLEKTLNVPMNLLAIIWLGLTIKEMTAGLSPPLELITLVIWAIFWIDFVTKLLISTERVDYLKHNFLTLLSLILPALRLFRIFTFLKYSRFLSGSRMIKILATFNRGMRALNKSLGRKGFGYVIALSLLVLLLGAAGIYNFESEETNYFQNFGSALWWSAMMLTTMGSDYFPKSSEGRVLAFLLAIYGFAVFGYVTASIASFFVDHSISNKPERSEAAHLKKLEQRIDELTSMIKELKEQGKNG